MSGAGVAEVNRVMAALEARRLDSLVMDEPGSHFQLSNLVRAYNQSHLRRALLFLRAARDQALACNGLAALSSVRAVYETLAAFLEYEQKLQPLLASGDLDSIAAFVQARTFATRMPELVEHAGDPAVVATNIIGQIDKMKRVYPNARDDYDHLCEYAHPNGLGAYLYFVSDDRPTNTLTFSDEGPDPADDLKWVLIAGHLLHLLDEAFGRIEQALPELSRVGSLRAPGNS